MNILSLSLVLAVVAFTWHYTLRCGYISDDHAAVEKRKDIIPDAERNPSKESYWVKVFNDGPVMYYLTELFLKLGFRRIPAFWHFLSLSIHLANCYLLHILLLPIIGYQASLAAVLFWGINPMLNQNVVWISGRPYLLGVFFSLIAMLCGHNPFIFMLFYMLAVMTNISIFFVPVIFLIINPLLWQAKLYLAIMILGALPYVFWKFKKRFTTSLVIDRENFKFKIRKINTLSRIILYYVWTFFVPVRMGWYHQAGFRYNDKWEKINYITVSAYLVLGFLLIRGGMPAYWLLLGLLPVSNIYATNAFVQDRYLYFASIGIAIMTAPVLLYHEAILYCATAFYVTRAYMYSRQLIDDEAMYRENWRNHPNSDHAVNNLAYFLIQQQRYDEARVVIMRGININQMNKMLWYNLGITWAAQGNFRLEEGKFRFLRALDCWKMALQIEPRWAKPAEDMKKLVAILIEKKVLTPNNSDSAEGMTMSLPAIAGMEGGHDE